ncbi:MAG: T9SS type A sorting domain-containing protein, partial [Bacteroidia bacterium]|nr:T9SS type A sorting domain-containing protein [Bacteroidia bacterium]
MKKIIFILTYTLLVLSTKAQVILIPDQNFKTCLLSDSTINTNFDNEIQLTEATNHSGQIECYGMNIADLTGIESFPNITKLNITSNQLTSLDISSNLYLTHLFCGNNQLTSLDVSSNTELAHLYCYNNLLTSINVTGDSSLEQFSCHQNYLTTIDVSTNQKMWLLKCNNNLLTNIELSNNHDLYALWCNDNSLSSLNLKNGNNAHIQNANFDTRNNPNLHCIEVSDIAYCTTFWTNIDSSSYFSENCSVNIDQLKNSNGFELYPNPFQDSFTIDLQTNSEHIVVQLFDLLGNKILESKISEKTTLDLNSTHTGMYLLKLI